MKNKLVFIVRIMVVIAFAGFGSLIIAYTIKTSSKNYKTIDDIKLEVLEDSQASTLARNLAKDAPEKSKLLEENIANQPSSRWLNGKIEDDKYNIEQALKSQLDKGADPVFVFYNQIKRSCNQNETAKDLKSYQDWYKQVIDSGIRLDRLIVIIEPDAQTLTSCLSPEEIRDRQAATTGLIDYLRQTFKNKVNIYIDIGHAKWLSVNNAVDTLKKNNIEKADGFSLNVSNFISTDDNYDYGLQIAKKLNKSFVLDTSRNGKNVALDEWCNPKDAKLGPKPKIKPGRDRLDAYLWIKLPGESDGTCNGGPEEGKFWLDYALNLIP